MKTITINVGARTLKALEAYKKYCDKECATGEYRMSGLVGQLVVEGLVAEKEFCKADWDIPSSYIC